MKKCKKKDGLIYDFEIVETKKKDFIHLDEEFEYRIYLDDDFICAMNEKEFKENFDAIEEDTESTNKSYSSILKEFVNSDYDGERSFWERAGAKRELTEVLLLLGRYKLTHYTEEFCKAILDKYKIPYEKNTTNKKEEEEVSYVVKPVDWYKTIGIDYTSEKFKEKVYSMIPSDESKEDYKKFLEIRDMMIDMKKQNILKQIKDKEEEIESNQELLAKGLKIPIARPVSQFFNDENRRLRAEIEALKCTLEGMEKK